MQPRPVYFSAIPILSLIILAVGIGAFAFNFASHQIEVYETQLEVRLKTAASTKAREVAAWRKERLADVRLAELALQGLDGVDRLVRGSIRGEDRRSAERLIENMRRAYGYRRILLTDLSGDIVISTGGVKEDEGFRRRLAAQALSSGTRTVDGFALLDGVPYFFVARVVEQEGRPDTASGVLQLTIDPRESIYASLWDWPGTQKTGELHLLRRDGADAVLLNEPRLQPGRALKLRGPLTESHLPAVQTILGKTESIIGVDYRGVEVLASSQGVAGTDWYVMAKIDRKEAIQPQTDATILLSMVMVALLLMGATLVGLMYHRRTARLFGEKYEAEKARLAAMGRIESLTKQANDGIVVCDTDGQILEANERLAQLYGYTVKKMLELNIDQILLQGSQDEFYRFLSLESDGDGGYFESLGRRKDGSVFETEISGRIIDLDNRRVVQGIVRDISGRKQAERQILRLNHLYSVLSHCNKVIVRASSEEELFREFCRTAVEKGGFRIAWIGRLDPETSVVVPIVKEGPEASYLDEVVITAGTGPTSKGPTGRCIAEGRAVASLDFQTEKDFEPWRVAAARHGLRSNVSIRLASRREEILVMGLYSSEAGLFSPEEVALTEEVCASLSFALDRLILERQRIEAERARREIQARLELALEASREAYWDWTAETQELFCSPSFYRMLGYEPGECPWTLEDCLGKSHPEDRCLIEENIRSLKENRENYAQFEYRLRHRDGHYIWVLMKVKVIERDENGQLTRVVGTRADITWEKRIQDQQRESQKMESIGRLAGGVAHDFNNILTVINGHCEILLAQPGLESELRGHVNLIRKSGSKAAELTRHLLAFSRRQVTQPEILSVNRVIAGFEDVLRRMIGEDIVLEVRLDPMAGSIRADAGQVTQVLMNLVVNSRDAMPAGGRMFISTADIHLTGSDNNGTAGAKPGRYVELTISDTGCGFNDEVRAHLFEPFFTTKRVGEGTGLGLAIVYGVVNEAGGFIHVDSQVGQGTTFRLYLPVVDDGEGLSEYEATPSATVHEPGAATILLVEDNPDLRELTQIALEADGYTVLSSPNAAEALSLFEKEADRIDLLLTDVVMAGMNGRELANELRVARPGLSVVFMSGYVPDQVLRQELEDTHLHYIRKPFTLVELERAVKGALRG